MRARKKEDKLAETIAKIDDGNYNAVGHIRVGRRIVKGKAAKQQEERRLASNAKYRAKYNLDPEYKEATQTRKRREYHAKTIAKLLEGTQRADICKVVVVVKAATVRAANAANRSDLLTIMHDAAMDGKVESEDVRTALTGRSGPRKKTAAGKRQRKLPLSEGPRTSTPPVNCAEFSGKGEGPKHKTLKEYVHKNCESILREISGRQVDVTSRQMECKLPSGDLVDVTACSEKTIWHIEVKSEISNESDIRRGLYQCVKYEAVEKVRQRVERPHRSSHEVKSVLVVENDLSDDLREIANTVPVPIYRIGGRMRRDLARQRA